MTKKAEVGNKCRWGPFKEVCKAIESQESQTPFSSAFWVQKYFWVQKSVGPKKIWGLKRFGVKINFGSKKFGVRKNLGQK